MNNENVYRQIHADPRFQELVAKRGRFAWTLAVIMLASYFAFILVILAGLVETIPVFAIGALCIGLGGGLFAHATLTACMRGACASFPSYGPVPACALLRGPSVVRSDRRLHLSRPFASPRS